jgi:hypothetical protein
VRGWHYFIDNLPPYSVYRGDANGLLPFNHPRIKRFERMPPPRLTPSHPTDTGAVKIPTNSLELALKGGKRKE